MKTGIAIIACDRENYTKECLESILANRGILNEIIIVNDGKQLPIGFSDTADIYNNIPPYQSVGVTKNKALKELEKRGCDHIFVIENDIKVLDPNVYQYYIDAARTSGILHLNFGYHGPANRDSNYNPIVRAVIEYPEFKSITEMGTIFINGAKIALNAHCVGAFSYYHKSFIKDVGIHDEYFKNAWEHVELCQRAIKKGYLPAFWWFPDVAGSYQWLVEQPGSIQNSSITHTPKWTENMKKGATYYKKLYGVAPVENKDTDIEIVKANLKEIYKKYRYKV